MTASRTTRRQVDEFWKLRRIAVVGVSRDPKHFSNTVWLELKRRGYDLVAVNPRAIEIDGQHCYGRLQDVHPPVEGALVMTPPRVTEQIVRDCADAGVRHVWLHRGAGIGSVSPAAVDFAIEHGMDVVAGHCPFMFLPGTPFFHGLHGWAKRLTGSYPT
ncbi:MAG TPA: CoA-binding protein [Candidatus Limnocylindrales bacterium]